MTTRVVMTLEQCWHRVPGGTATAALGMARGLASHPDFDLRGVAARHPRPAPAEWSPPIEVFQMPLPRIAMYEAWHRIRRPRVQLACGRTDLIHATTLAIPPHSAPLVVTIHDLAFLHDAEHFTKRGLRFFNRGLELAIAEADLVLCSSHATLTDCEAAGFDSERLRHAPLGVDATSVSTAAVESCIQRYSLRRPYVLWTGTVEPRKNLRNLLRAFASVDGGAQLVLVGPRGWKEDLGALIEPLADRVTTLGFIPAADLAALYAGAEVFCYPSLLEGFGFPVLEAMSQGTAVVTSHGTSTAEISGDAAVLVDPHDPDSIAQAIDQLLRDEALRSKLAEAGRDQARLYTWERTARLVAAAYAEVLN